MPISEKTKMFELPIDLKKFFKSYCKEKLTNPSIVLRRFIEWCQAIENNEEIPEKTKLLKLPDKLIYNNESKISTLSFRIPEDLRIWFNQYCKKRRYTSTEVFVRFINVCKYFEESNINLQIEDIIIAIAIELHYK